MVVQLKAPRAVGPRAVGNWQQSLSHRITLRSARRYISSNLAPGRSPDSWFPGRKAFRHPRLPERYRSVAHGDDFPLTVARPHRLLTGFPFMPLRAPEAPTIQTAIVSSAACHAETSRITTA